MQEREPSPPPHRASRVAQEKGAPGARSASFPNSIICAFIKHIVLELSFLLFQCLFVFCGGLGVGEKPARCELVRSTYRVPSPFIPKFHRNRSRKYNNTALFLGSC